MVTYRLQKILKSGKKEHIPKGHVLQTTDNQRRFMMLGGGFVKRYMITNNGTLSTEVIYGTNDIFPLTTLYKAIFGLDINDSPETYYYETIVKSVIYSVEIDEMLDHIKREPIIYKSLFLEAGTRLHSTLNGLESMSLPTSYQKLAHELLYLAERFGEKTPWGTKITVPLTHQDLADILSLTRETVSNNMVRLRKDGFIKTGRNIVVPDIKKLQQEAFS
jgi:CRP-like cAMP-binding protein